MQETDEDRYKDMVAGYVSEELAEYEPDGPYTLSEGCPTNPTFQHCAPTVFSLAEARCKKLVKYIERYFPKAYCEFRYRAKELGRFTRQVDDFWYAFYEQSRNQNSLVDVIGDTRLRVSGMELVYGGSRKLKWDYRWPYEQINEFRAKKGMRSVDEIYAEEEAKEAATAK